MVFAYEPGSVNKVITAAAAVEEGIAKPDSTRLVPAKIVTPCGKTFLAHGQTADENLTLTDIITRSSNTGTMALAGELNKTRLDKYMRAFGLGSKTGLGFPEESAGILMAAKDYNCTSLDTISIGQGVAATPMQMASVYATIANNGVYQPPRLVNATIDTHGDRYAIGQGRGRRVVSAATAKAVTAMLVNVVEGIDGTGHRAAISGYRVAGKTGTAQKPQTKGFVMPNGDVNRYMDETGVTHYYSSFVGFAPAEDPQMVVLVSIDEPNPVNNQYYAGVAAAPLFQKVMQEALRSWRVTPRTDVVVRDATSEQPGRGDIADAGTSLNGQ